MTAEVVVVGAGLVGAATARELAVRGVDVLLLDAGEVSGGTTGLGEGNVLCSDKEAGPELELTVAGLALYDELAARLGDAARIRRKGALIVHTDAATWADEPERLERLRAAGVESEVVDARAAEPRLTGEVHGAVLFAGDLQCDPRAIARALAREVPRVATGTRVAALERGGVRLSTDERIAAGAVVLAAGPWSGALAASAGLRLPVEPRKGQLVRLSAPADDYVRHKVVEAAYMASVASTAAELQVTTVVETIAGGDVLVGSSRERVGFDEAVDPAVSDAMVARAARLFGDLAALPRTAAWSGLRPWLPDHLPAIGPSQVVPGLWLATGHEGAGVALGPVTGRLVAQAYCGESPLMDLAAFDPDRFER